MKKITAILATVVFMSGVSTALAAEANPLTVSGDVRIRFDKQNNYNLDGFNAEKYRVRVNLGYKFSPEWNFNSRFVVGENFFNATPIATPGKDYAVPDNAQVDIASFTYKKPDWNATVGRQMLTLFEGLAVGMDDGHSAGNAGYAASANKPDGSGAKNYPSLQGVKLENKLGDVKLTSFYGNLNNRIAGGINYNVGGIAAMAPVGKVNLGAMWYTTDSKAPAGYGFKDGRKNGYSITANTKINNYLYTGAEYIWGLADSHDKAWKLIVKTPDTKKPGDMQYAAEYRNIEQNALDTPSSVDTVTYCGLSNAYKSYKYGDYSFVALSAKRQLSPNTSATLYYEKYNPTVITGSSQIQDDVYRLQFDVKF